MGLSSWVLKSTKFKHYIKDSLKVLLCGCDFTFSIFPRRQQSSTMFFQVLRAVIRMCKMSIWDGIQIIFKTMKEDINVFQIETGVDNHCKWQKITWFTMPSGGRSHSWKGPQYWVHLSISINVNALPSPYVEVLSLDAQCCCNYKQFFQADIDLVQFWICVDFLYFLHSQSHSNRDADRKPSVTEKCRY